MDPKAPETDYLRSEAERLTEDFITLYQEKVLAFPHRSVVLTGRKCSTPRINTTLLGFELQIRDRRFSCPDMATARFLKIFAMIGAGEVKVPLDPTRTAEMLPVFEQGWNEFQATCRKLESENRKKLALRMQGRLQGKAQVSQVKKAGTTAYLWCRIFWNNDIPSPWSKCMERLLFIFFRVHEFSVNNVIFRIRSC